MSIGAIICLTNEMPAKWNQDKEVQFRDQLESFDMIRIIPTQVNSYLLHCLYLDVVKKGMTEIVIAKAQFCARGRLELDHLYCRLPVRSMNYNYTLKFKKYLGAALSAFNCTKGF